MSKVKVAKVPSPGSQKLAVQGRDPRASGFQVMFSALRVRLCLLVENLRAQLLLGQSCRKMGTCLLPLCDQPHASCLALTSAGHAGLPGMWDPVKRHRGPERALGALSTVLL